MSEESRHNVAAEVVPLSARLPRVIEDAGPRVGERFLEFFAAQIRNRGTREAYGRAVGQFLLWSILETCISRSRQETLLLLSRTLRSSF